MGERFETPVTLPPGAASDFTTLAASKLVTAVATTGIILVARAMACTAGVDEAKISWDLLETKRVPILAKVA